MLRFFPRMRRVGWLAAAALSLAACSAPEASWQLISPQGYPLTNHAPGALVFLDDSTGLLLGSAWSDEAARINATHAEQVSTVFRTTDGGRHWQLKAISKGKRFILATCVGRTAYAVELRQERPDSSPNDSSQVLRSVDGGLSWQPLGRVPGQVRGISFTDTSQGFLLTDQPTGLNADVYHTADGGRSWQLTRLQRPLLALDGVAAPNGQAWLLLAPPGPHPADADSLARVDWRTGAVTTEAIPGCLVAEAPKIDAAGNLWLAGAAPDGGTLLLRREAGTDHYTQIHRFAPSAGQQLQPVALQLSGRSLSLLLARSTPERSAYCFFHSTDAGQSWREEQLTADQLDLGPPVAFFGPDRVWLSTDSARLLVRQPRR